MAVKFVIYNDYQSECEYCRAVCKLADPELTDADFHLVYTGAGFTSNSMATTVEYYRENYSSAYPKPLLIMPINLSSPSGRASLVDSYLDYPDIPIVTSFYAYGALPDLPAALALDPDRLSHLVLVGGGVSGLSDWYTGAGLEFVEEATIQYLNGGSNVTSFAVTNVTDQGGGVARISSTGIHNYASVKMKIHIAGVSGFANDINGKRTIVAKGTGYVDVTFTLGAGTFSGPSANAKIQWVSGAISVVAAKLNKIMRERNCSFWEARYTARQTGSASGTHDVTTGYGSIDADDAIAYDLSVPGDPYDTIGEIGTLALSVVDNAATFTHPEIVGAKQAVLYANDVALFTWDPALQLLGRTLTYVHYPISLGNINYKLVGVRGSQLTANSNTVNTNITELTGLPEAPIYEVGFLTYYWNGADLNSSQVASVNQLVSNPENNNVGVVETIYVLEDGAAIPETRLYASANDALAGLVPGFYLNAVVPLSVDVFVPAGDLAGQDFRGTDFTVDGDYDFTGGIVANTNFDGAILPTAYDDLEGLELFLSQVAYCNVKTTIWVNGLTVEEELEA